jgi:ZIP family zinc transporter
MSQKLRCRQQAGTSMSPLATSLGLATLAGITMPLGALLAQVARIHPRWLEAELRHSMIAFGGGVLLAAASLVLVPEAISVLTWPWIVLAFGGGGFAFFLLDRAIERRGGEAALLMAMLLDFIPEAMAVGAALASGMQIGMLLVLLIALQNLPESFNAYREIIARGQHSRQTVLTLFSLLVLLGPLSAYVGHAFLASAPALLAGVMLFAAGGIIYLTFEDIAPQAVLRRHWAPPLGAVAGFLLGIVGRVAFLT